MRIVCSKCKKKDKIIKLGKARELWIIGSFGSLVMLLIISHLESISSALSWIGNILFCCLLLFCAVKAAIKEFQRMKLEKGEVKNMDKKKVTKKKLDEKELKFIWFIIGVLFITGCVLLGLVIKLIFGIF